jgi:hypothetical protein
MLVSPIVSVVELTVLDLIANAIVADAYANGEPELSKNYAEGEVCFGLPFVAAARIDEVISDTTAIRAQCLSGQAIQIYLPCNGRTDAVNIAKRPEVVRTVFGALVHELAHVRQFGTEPAKYHQTVARQFEYEKAVCDRTPAEWLRGYYSEELEFEAHAVQLAAEMKMLGLQVQVAEPHGSWIGATEVSRRIYSRLFPVGETASTATEEWWSGFIAAVAELSEAWIADSATAEVSDTAIDQGDLA